MPIPSVQLPLHLATHTAVLQSVNKLPFRHASVKIDVFDLISQAISTDETMISNGVQLSFRCGAGSFFVTLAPGHGYEGAGPCPGKPDCPIGGSVRMLSV